MSVVETLMGEIEKEYKEYQILRQDVGEECAKVMWEHYYGPQINFLRSIIEGEGSTNRPALERWLTLEVLPLEE